MPGRVAVYDQNVLIIHQYDHIMHHMKSCSLYDTSAKQACNRKLAPEGVAQSLVTATKSAELNKSYTDCLFDKKANLMIAPYQVHVLGVLNLERQQEANGFQGVRPSVHIVPKEQVVNVGDVSSSRWRPILLKETHEVSKLTMKITE